MSKRLEDDEIFEIENDVTGKKKEINSSSAFRELNNMLNSVTGEQMRQKALVETNPTRKKLMLLYSERWNALHN
jgi:hypothetical protein